MHVGGTYWYRQKDGTDTQCEVTEIIPNSTDAYVRFAGTKSGTKVSMENLNPCWDLLTDFPGAIIEVEMNPLKAFVEAKKTLIQDAEDGIKRSDVTESVNAQIPKSEKLTFSQNTRTERIVQQLPIQPVNNAIGAMGNRGQCEAYS